MEMAPEPYIDSKLVRAIMRHYRLQERAYEESARIIRDYVQNGKLPKELEDGQGSGAAGDQGTGQVE